MLAALLEAGDPNILSVWEPSVITAINGVATTDVLKQFASSNSPGTVELHADWNHIMSSPASDIQDILSLWQGNTPFRPGNNITFEFENGTEPLQL